MALSNAERQRRYRQRRRDGEAKAVYRKPKGRQSRKERLQAAIETIIAIRDEYQGWRDSVPETLEGTATVERLDEALDLDGLAALDLPRGYGRDE